MNNTLKKLNLLINFTRHGQVIQTYFDAINPFWRQKNQDAASTGSTIWA